MSHPSHPPPPAAPASPRRPSQMPDVLKRAISDSRRGRANFDREMLPVINQARKVSESKLKLGPMGPGRYEFLNPADAQRLPSSVDEQALAEEFERAQILARRFRSSS